MTNHKGWIVFDLESMIECPNQKVRLFSRTPSSARTKPQRFIKAAHSGSDGLPAKHSGRVASFPHVLAVNETAGSIKPPSALSPLCILAYTHQAIQVCGQLEGLQTAFNYIVVIPTVIVGKSYQPTTRKLQAAVPSSGQTASRANMNDSQLTAVFLQDWF
ncbi:MAG: hypothetical protein ABSC88_09965 [Terracidiphilus sp.]